MGKKTTTLLLSGICFLLQFSYTYPQYTPDSKLKKINGDYKSCIVYGNSALAGKFENGSRVKTEAYTFNNKGEMTGFSSYETNGKLNEKNTFKYDQKGNVIEKVDYKSDDSTIYCFTEFKYNKKGNPTNENIHGADSVVFDEYLYEYDKEDRLISKIRKKNEVWHWDITVKDYQYDNTGMLVNERSYYESGLLNTSIVYEYDKNKNEKTALYYSDYGVNYVTFRYTYDNEENLIESGRIGTDSVYSKEKSYKYDADGNLTDEIDYDKYTSCYKITYKYNKDRKLIEEGNYNKDESLINKSLYSYDANGNIIEIMTYDKSDQPFAKTEYIYSK